MVPTRSIWGDRPHLERLKAGITSATWPVVSGIYIFSRDCRIRHPSSGCMGILPSLHGKASSSKARLEIRS